MPLFYKKKTDSFTQLAVWKITEDEAFFLEKVNLQNEITHPHKRLQHLAGRYLLQYLQPDFPLHLLSVSTSKKPFLLNERYHFSVSHCGDFAAVIISEKSSTGIDVELVTPKIAKIKNKYLGSNELSLFENSGHGETDLKWLTLFWSAKEAMFKWYGKGSVDFKKNMIIEQLSIDDDGGFLHARFEKEITTSLVIHFKFFENLCLAWVSS